MTEYAPAEAEQARAVISDVLAGIAPDADLDGIDPDGNLQQQADLDSMDFLSLVEGIAGRLGLDIPEADYDQLATLTSAISYLARRMQPV